MVSDIAIFDYLRGDPWEGSQDIAGEDLADFLGFQLQLKDGKDGFAGDGRLSTMSAASTAASAFGSHLGWATPRSFASSSAPTARPSLGWADRSPSLPLVEPAIVEAYEEDAGEEDAWEVEFMLRSTLDKPKSRGLLPSEQLRQIELLATEVRPQPQPTFVLPSRPASPPPASARFGAEADESGDRALALMARCRERMLRMSAPLA